jgi:outer membrane protein insertion porin family
MSGRFRPALWGGIIVILALGVWLAWSVVPGVAAGWVFATLETEWGVIGHAGQVDFNPVTLEVQVRDLTLAAAGDEEQPFLTAREITVDLAWSTVFGAPAIEVLDIVEPVLSVRQEADGSSNLPTPPTGEPSSDSPAELLRPGVIGVHRGSVTWVDETRGVSVTVDPADLQMSPAADTGSRTTGRLTLATPTRITWGGRDTVIDPLSARLTLDDSTLAVRELVATAPEGRLALDGDIALSAPSSVLRFEYGLDLDLPRLAAWLEPAPELTGTVRIVGRVDGPLADLETSARLESDRIGWENIEASGVTAAAHVAGGRITVDEIHATLADGRVDGEGVATLIAGDTSGEAHLSWTDVSAERLSAAVWSTRPVAIASRLTGEADVSWTGSDPRAWVVALETRHRASRDVGMPSVPIDGRWRFESADGGWRAEVERLSSGAMTLTGLVTGSVPSALAEFGAVPIDGVVEGRVSDLRQLVADLETPELTDALSATGLSGTASLALDVSGQAGAPVVTGELLASGGALGRDDGLALRAGLSTAGGRWRLDPVDLRLGGSEATGTAAMQPDTGAIEGNLRVRIPDLAQLDTVLPDGWLPGGAIEVAGSLGGQWPTPIFDAAIGASSLVFAGQRFASVGGRVRVSPDDVVVEQLSVRQDDGVLEATGSLTPATGRYALSVTGRGLQVYPWHIGAADPLPVRAIVDLDLAGSGSTDAPRGTGRVVMRNLSFRDSAFARVEHDLSVDADGWHVRSVVPALAVSTDLTVVPEEAWRYELDGRLAGTSFARLGTLVTGGTEDPGRFEGTLSMRVRADGNMTGLSDSTLVVNLERVAGRVNGTAVQLAAPAVVRYSREGIGVDSLDLRVGASRLIASGSLASTPGSALNAGLRGDLRDLESLLPRSDEPGAGAASVALAGPIQLDASLTGSVDQPSLIASLALDGGAVGLAGVEGAPPISDLRVRAGYDATGVRLDELRGRWEGAAISASGMIPPPLLAPYLPARLAPAAGADSPARLRATVEALTPAAFSMFFDEGVLHDVVGELGVEVDLEADQLTVAGLRGSLALTALELAVAGLPVTQQRPTRLALRDQRLTVDRLAWQLGDAGNVITLGGSVDMVPEPTADLTVTGVADLRLVTAFTGAAALSGNANLIANVGGTLAAPRIDGVVEFEDAEVRVPDPRLLVTDLAGALVFEGSEMRTVELAGTANGGPVRLDGVFRFPGLIPEGSLSLSGREIALVLPPGVRTELDTDLQLAVASDDAVLSGTLSVRRGDYRERVNTAGGLAALLESRSESAFIAAEPSWVDRLRLDIRVLTEDGIVVNNNYGSGTLTADTQLGGTVARPAVTGRATVGDGGQVFLGGNAFEIETGTIDFVDPDGIVPDIDVTARTRVGNEEITITLAGTAETLTTTMQSSSGRSESDIVSLLLTGRTLDQVGSAPGAVARDQALGLVSSEVLGAAGRSVGLDSVRVERDAGQGNVRFDASLAGVTNPGSRLTVAKNLNSQVQIVASQSLRESGLLTWIVNYAPRPNVEMRLVIDDQTDRSYEFRHALTFGGAQALTTPTAMRVEPRVTAVRFSGASSVPEPELRRQVHLVEGDRFDFLRWQDDRDRLERAMWDDGFQEARVRARRDVDETGSSVELGFDVESGPRSILDIRGYAFPSALRREMEAAWRASVFDTFLVEELEQVARRHLVEQRYLQPIVTVAVAVDADQGDDEKRIILDVEPGPRTVGGVIRFSGYDRLTDERLGGLVTPARDTDAWAGGDELVEAVVATYRAEGLLAATASLRQPVFDGATAALEVDIVEGPVFRVSEVSVVGPTAWSTDQVRAAAGVASGAVYTADLAAAARAGLLVAYRGAGFNAVRVRVEPTIDTAGGEVTLRIVVEEGRRQQLRNIEVVGAARTDAGLITRALRLQPGEPVDQAVWNQARKRLYDTGVFRSVDITAVPLDLDVDPTVLDEPVTARVTLQEWPSYQLRYGLQLIDERAPASEISEHGQIGVVADLTRQNLFGRAVTLGAAVRYDTVQQAVRGFMSLPSFFGRRVTSNLFGVRLRDTLGENGTVVSDRHGLTLEQQVRPREGLTVSYSFNFDRDHTFDTDLGLRFPVDRTVDIARLNTSLVFEHRDDLFNATRGWFHASTIEWAIERLGSDLRFLKFLGQHSYFRALPGGVVLASAARVGLGGGFGQELIPSERFFAGGGNTVRGYEQDGLGPVDFVFGGASGGSASVVLNQEVRFPLWSIFGGVGFLDAGNVFTSMRDVSFLDLPVGTGVGLRVETPVGLFRVDLGFPLSRAEDDPLARWFLSLGQAF